MTQAQQPEALRLAAICETKGMFPVADELNRMHARILELEQGKCLLQIAEPSAQTPEDAQIQALMRKHRIWIEHSTLFENDEPERELRAVQAEEHQFNAFVLDLIAATQLAAAPQAVQATEEMRVCNSEECGWIGPLSETYGYKNSPATLCPECKETTELSAPAHPAEGVPASMAGSGILFHCERATQPAAQGMDAQDAECLEIGRELNRACVELPWGYEIILHLEQGAGTVHWMDQDGNEHDIDEDGMFSEKIGYAIAAAQAKQGGAA